MSENRTALRLGRDAAGGEVALPAAALVRHVMALGSSGSGKTALCKVVVEEAVLAGIPVICLDPQGDLCSLALDPPGDPDGDGDRGGVDAARAAAFRERADVVVFTPASRVGVPLCADPIGAAGDLGGDSPEAVHARTRAADMVAALLGYDADSDDGAGLRAVLDTALAELAARGAPARRLEDLTVYLADADADALARWQRYLDARVLRTAAQRLARLDVGARRLLFHVGLPIDIDTLIGRGPRGGAVPGRTRVAVIYLNSLHSQDDKDFAVAALAERLYGWMLRNPSADPQLLFYIDEVAPFLPPVRKPACKPGLSLLFKQARKYGVGCVMATQNPGDVDYKAMSQFGTWALGRLTTRQDLGKIAPIVKSLAPERADAIVDSLPARRPGEFALLSPDWFDEPVTLSARWLLTPHETLDEPRIEQLATAWRDRFPDTDSTIAEPAKPSALEPAATIEPATDSDESAVEPAPTDADEHAGEPASTDADEHAVEPAPTERRPRPSRSVNFHFSTAGDRPPEAFHELSAERPPKNAERGGTGEAGAAPGQEIEREQRPERLEPDDDPAPDPKAAARAHHVELLGQLSSMSAREFAARAACGQTKARAVLADLVAHDLARVYQDGRTRRWFAVHTGLRPDLALDPTVAVVTAQIDRDQVIELARGMQRSRLLGLVGEDEAFESAELLYRPVYQVVFEEQVRRSVLLRLFGQGSEQLIGTTYHHPRTLQVLVYTPRRGIVFADQPGALASEIEDFDGLAGFDDVAPGTLAIDDAACADRRSTDDVRRHFSARFEATPREVATVFVPLWRVLLRQPARGNYRVVELDALVGRPVDWPG